MRIELRRVTVRAPGAANARQEWPERTSVLVRLHASGRAGVGEASPLPGYSCETLDAAEAALRDLRVADVARCFDHEVVLEALAAGSELVSRTLPAARFALETALLDLLGQARRLSAPALLGACPGAARALCALIGSAADPSLLERASNAVASGYACLKVKLGAPGKLELELAQIVELRRRLVPSVALRLDANGALSAHELELGRPALTRAEVELFEEPGAGAPHVPIGVDESLQGLDDAQAEAHMLRTGAAAVVLKPTALGGIHHCWAVARRARAAGAAAIVSHCFDGPWAFRAAAALALALPECLPHGLAPHAALAHWPVSAASCVREGRLLGWTEPGLGLQGGFE